MDCGGKNLCPSEMRGKVFSVAGIPTEDRFSLVCTKCKRGVCQRGNLVSSGSPPAGISGACSGKKPY